MLVGHRSRSYSSKKTAMRPLRTPRVISAWAISAAVRFNPRSIFSTISALNDDGLFLLSIFQPDHSFLYRDEYLYEARTFFDYHGKQCRMMERNSFDDETQINSLTWQLEIDGDLSDESYSFKQRMYYPHKMDLLFQETGFSIQEKFGDWSMNPLGEESPLQIYICKCE